MKLNKSDTTLGVAFATSVLAAAIMSTPAVAGSAPTERCADIVKSGKNSCAVKSLGISCMGHATEDNIAGAWIKVPAGTCANIIAICDGSADAPADADAKRVAKSCEKIAEQSDQTIVGGRVVDKNGESI